MKTPCVLCMQGEGSVLNGGYCASCRPPLNASPGPAAFLARDIARAFPRPGGKKEEGEKK